MKVLQLINSAGYYGAEAMLTNLTTALMGLDCQVVVGVFRNTSTPRYIEIADHARREGLPVKIIPCDGRADRATTQSIRDYVRSERIDLLHTHGYKADIYGFAAARKLQQPIIATCHNWTAQSLSVQAYEYLDRLILRTFDRVVAVSESVAARLKQVGVKENKITVIGNGVNIDVFRDASPTYAKEIGKARRVAVGMVGRLVEAKGPQHLLAAIPVVLKLFPETVFVFLGDGPERSRFEQLASELHVEKNVIFAGQRHDMPTVYASLDVVVLPSLWEAMPMTIIEAMAARKPVIASRVGAIPHMITHGCTGLLVEPGNVSELTDALVRLLSDEDLRNKLGTHGHHWAAGHFSSKVMAQHYLDIYHQALSHRRRAA